MPTPRAGRRIHIVFGGGQGAPLLLCHGMAANSYWWATTVPALREHFRVAAMDFSGHGDSAWAQDGVYDTQRWMEDIETARRELGFTRFMLCGHSMGARIALEYAKQRPEALSGLIAIDFLPASKHAKGRRSFHTRTPHQPVYDDLPRMIEKFHLQPAGTLLTAEEMRDFAQYCIKRSEGGGYTWKFDWRAFLYRYEDIWPTLPDVRVPALIVRGEHSTIISAPDLERVVRELPNAYGAQIPRAHHHIPLDAPRQLAVEMTGFLKRLGV